MSADPERERHDHPRRAGRGHVHGLVDPVAASTERGMWALKWSFVALTATAVGQAIVVAVSGSVALLADTIHNVADAGSAVPLWIAFALARMRPARGFSYGYGRVEDLAGVAIVLTILVSGLIAGYEALLRLVQPAPVEHLEAVTAAAVLGFAGNEAVATLRIRVGRAIGSAALVADGYHARADGLTSLAVLGAAGGVWLGYPLADPIVGLLITAVILGIVGQSARPILRRMLDGVEPDVLDAAAHAARHAPGVGDVTDVRARWSGHRLLVELDVAVDARLSVSEGHAIAKEVRHQIQHHLPHVARVTVHVDPATEPGEDFHRVAAHAHDGLPTHSHL